MQHFPRPTRICYMLSFGAPFTAANLKVLEDYYRRDDYYLQEIGEWHGKGAELLGLRGIATAEDFANAIRGRDRDGHRLTSGNEETRRVGLDMTFSAPKSASILTLADDRIKSAHLRAVKSAADAIERDYAQTRDQTGGRVRIEDTGNLTGYMTTHMTSRELDPQLHTHWLIMNMTRTAKGEWKALHFDAVYEERFKQALGTYYRNEFIKELRGLGYEIEVTDRTKGLFEVKGVPREMIDYFSKRREQILERVEELRKVDAYKNVAEGKLFEMAAFGTRSPKEVDPDMPNIMGHWIKEIVEQGYNLKNIHQAAISAGQEKTQFYDIAKSPYDFVKEAAIGVTETTAVFTKEQIGEIAQYLAMGKKTGGEVSAAFDTLVKDKVIIKLGKNAFTTKEMINLEREVVERILAGRGTAGRIDDDRISSFLEEKNEVNMEKNGFTYKQGQEEAIRLISSSTDKVVLIQGDAGTGKTTMLEAVKEIYEGEGWQVLGMSFTGKATRELKNESGIKSATILSYLQSNKDSITPGKTVWVVDEASMLGSKNFADIMRLADRYNAKIVLVGDKKQFLSISAGRMFSIMQEQGMVPIAKMTEVTRQKTDYTKEIVKLISESEGLISKSVVQALKMKFGETSRNAGVITTYFVDNVFKGNWRSLNASPTQRYLLATILKKDVKTLAKPDLEIARDMMGKDLVKGLNIEKAVEVLKANGKICEIKDREARLDYVAGRALVQIAEGKTPLVITAMNRDREALNQRIRSALVESGKLEQGRQFTVEEPLSLGGQMKMMADSYQKGHIVVLLAGAKTIEGKEIATGIKGEVVDRNVERNTITLSYLNKKTKQNETVEIDVGKYAGRFSVYQTKEEYFSAGERILFLKNDKKLGVENGSMATVVRIDEHGNCEAKLDTKQGQPIRTVKFNLEGMDQKGGVAYNCVVLGYATTEMKSQGMTVDKHIWHIEADAKFKDMTTTNSGYVAMTREREDIEVVASDINELTKMIKESQVKLSTLDLYKPGELKEVEKELDKESTQELAEQTTTETHELDPMTMGQNT